MILTHHMAMRYGIERGTYQGMAHFIDGIGYVGDAGLKLDDALAAVNRAEADALLADLRGLGARMLADDRHRGTTDCASLSRMLIDLATDIMELPAEPDRQEYRTWTADELDAIDTVLESTAWRMPSAAEIRMLAETFDRTPKSVQSQLERRISTAERLDAHMAAMRAERKAEG